MGPKDASKYAVSSMSSKEAKRMFLKKNQEGPQANLFILQFSVSVQKIGTLQCVCTNVAIFAIWPWTTKEAKRTFVVFE